MYIYKLRTVISTLNSDIIMLRGNIGLVRQILHDCTYMWNLQPQTQKQSTMMVSVGSRGDEG